MPKEQRDRSMSLEKSRFSPFPCSSSSKKPLPQNPLEDDTNTKQWEDARCPVCIEHPHNAILLLCSSHEKGCRPFMCDTSYRHSNCFDQFRKSFDETPSSDVPIPGDLPNSDPSPFLPDETNPEPSNEEHTIPLEDPTKPKLVCPLCRGSINGWVVVESARHFMNAKSRSCACEECDYSGVYKDLRKHARSVHPLVRPADVDPDRQLDWRRLERQRDLGDLISTLQSSMVGGGGGEEERTLTVEDGGWLTVYFLVRFIAPGNNRSERNSTQRAGGTQAEPSRSLRRLWGETFEGDDTLDEEGEDESSPVRRSVPRRYVRRRYRGSD